MRRYLLLLLAALLAAGAVFLPGQLSQWGDQVRLDEPHITRQDEEREGFAESLQLSVAEKLFLLRSGSVISVALEDMETAAVYFKNQGGNITLESASLWQPAAWTSRPQEGGFVFGA